MKICQNKKRNKWAFVRAINLRCHKNENGEAIKSVILSNAIVFQAYLLTTTEIFASEIGKMVWTEIITLSAFVDVNSLNIRL